MADYKLMIPFIIKWETGTIIRSGETYGALFERARAKGFANDPADAGGATQTGVTLAAYQQWCSTNHLPKPNAEGLKHIPFSHWCDILKRMYWDRWRADDIENQAVAELLVDFVWASGKYGITRPQKLLGVTADGIVGPKTISALNRAIRTNARGIWDVLLQNRRAYINEIIRTHPLWEKWRKGWNNRINDLRKP